MMSGRGEHFIIGALPRASCILASAVRCRVAPSARGCSMAIFRPIRLSGFWHSALGRPTWLHVCAGSTRQLKRQKKLDGVSEMTRFCSCDVSKTSRDKIAKRRSPHTSILPASSAVIEIPQPRASDSARKATTPPSSVFLRHKLPSFWPYDHHQHDH